MKKQNIILIGIVSLLLPTLAQANNVVFNNPKVGGYGLDFCREWMQNCGQPAADAFCQSKGLPKAIHFEVLKNNQKTRVINGGQVCDAPMCDRVSKVVCQSKQKTFVNPQVGGYGLDYCREWTRNCGQPAADAFCNSKGFNRAINFEVTRNNQKTRVINGGQVCDAPMCDRIARVTCE